MMDLNKIDMKSKKRNNLRKMKSKKKIMIHRMRTINWFRKTINFYADYVGYISTQISLNHQSIIANYVSNFQK